MQVARAKQVKYIEIWHRILYYCHSRWELGHGQGSIRHWCLSGRSMTGKFMVLFRFRPHCVCPSSLRVTNRGTTGLLCMPPMPPWIRKDTLIEITQNCYGHGDMPTGCNSLPPIYEKNQHTLPRWPVAVLLYLNPKKFFRSLGLPSELSG